MSDFYSENREYYDRNANSYEKSSWYFFNKYKDKTLEKELKYCMNIINKDKISVLEFGPGTGYLLSKLLLLGGSKFNYTGVEHSNNMCEMLQNRYKLKLDSFTVFNKSVSKDFINENLIGNKYDIIIGSSILHHLPDYEEVIKTLPKILNRNGIIYFVREPIHKNECKESKKYQEIFNRVYNSINSFFLLPSIRNILWPQKTKQENPQKIALHMFKDGVSINPFLELTKVDFETIIFRKYNRRASSFFSYMENQWLKKTRKDIFGNTLFAIGLQKKDA